MGCDGGSIPHRSEMVHTKKKKINHDHSFSNKAKWQSCALSKQPLSQPIVSCNLGKLYNRESILEYLINPKAFGDASQICPHIHSLKDIYALKVTENSNQPDQESTLYTGTIEKTKSIKFICSVSLREMNGTSRFCFITSCGCLMSELALKEIQSSHCLVCQKEFKKEDVLNVYPEGGDLENMQKRLEILLIARQEVKDNKKRLLKESGEIRVKKMKIKVETKGKSGEFEYDFDKVNEFMNLPNFESCGKHREIDSKAVQGIYHKGGAQKTNPLFSGSFTRNR